MHRLVSIGDMLVSAGAGGRLCGWDTADRRLLVELTGHADDVYAIDAHPRQPLLASGDAAGHVRVWDVAAGELRHAFEGHTGAIYCVAFSPAGDLLASGDSAGTVCLWDTATGRLQHKLTGHTGSVWPFEFRPDGGQLAVSDDQLTTSLWDPATGTCVHTMSGHGRRVGDVRFSADRRRCSPPAAPTGWCGCGTPTVGRQVRAIAAHRTGCRTAGVQPGRAASGRPPTAKGACSCSTSTPACWSAYLPHRYGADLGARVQPLRRRHRDLRRRRRRARVASHHGQAGAHRWPSTAGRVRAIAYSHDGTVLATGCDDSRVRLWNAASGQLAADARGPHRPRVRAGVRPTGRVGQRVVGRHRPTVGPRRPGRADTCSPGTPDGCGQRRSTRPAVCSPRRATTW